MSLFSLLLPDADLPSTVENATVTPEDEAAAVEETHDQTERITDLAQYDDDITAGLERGTERLAKAFAVDVDA